VPDHPFAVVARSLVLAYGRHVALGRSDFRLEPGSVTAIIGPNGSGKSTLLHAIAGLLEPASGTLEVGERTAAAGAAVGYVLQSTQVNELLPVTVREVVTMGRYADLGAFGRLRASDRRAVDEALDRLEIADLASRQLRELSGGQRQRVFVAQGLAQRAPVLLLDEPVTGLDLVSRHRILEVLAAERERGVTVVVSTHDLDDAAAAEHVLLLAGRVVAAGPPAAVLTPEWLAQAYGGRLLRVDGGAVLLDDPAHRHDRSTDEAHGIARTGDTEPGERQ